MYIAYTVSTFNEYRLSSLYLYYIIIIIFDIITFLLDMYPPSF
jgi:hypothetical protein